MKKVLVSFIGNPRKEYDEVDYRFPSAIDGENGISFKSSLFLMCYLRYRKYINDPIDKLIIIGTDTSLWSALLDGCKGCESLVTRKVRTSCSIK